MSNFLGAGDYKHPGDILEWITQEQEEVTENASKRGWSEVDKHEITRGL